MPGDSKTMAPSGGGGQRNTFKRGAENHDDHMYRVNTNDERQSFDGVNKTVAQAPAFTPNRQDALQNKENM